MYDTSEEAMQDNRAISLGQAEAELRRHHCRVIDTRGGQGRFRILATNDCDAPEWIDCTTRSVLEFLGY